MPTLHRSMVQLVFALYTLSSVTQTYALPEPTAAPDPHALPQPNAAPAPTALPIPALTDLNALTPDDLILDSRDFTNGPADGVLLADRNYGGGSNPAYGGGGGGGCPGCGQQHSSWRPATSWHQPTTWAPATSWHAAGATIIETVTHCPECEAGHRTTYYKTTTWCPPTTTWRQTSWHATSKWHTSYRPSSYVQPAGVVYTKTVQPVYTTVVAQSAGPGPICSTLIANGPGLPTTRQGGCGTILVINGAVSSTTTRAVWFGLVSGAAVALFGAIWA